MMSGFLRAGFPQAAKPLEPELEPEKLTAANPLAAWGEMMDRGHEVQRQHLASLQQIFDTVWGKPPERS